MLDGLSNVFAARSLRLLRTAYAGDVVLARRSTDNAELAFDAVEYVSGTLDSWVGIGNAEVVRCYDQSGNGYDWSQSTALEQSRIWESGSVLTKGGFNAMRSPVDGDMRNSETTGLPSTASLIVSGAWEALAGYATRFTLLDDPGAGKYCGFASDGDTGAWYASCGTPTARLNGVAQSWTDRNTMFDAVAAAGVCVIRIDGIDMSGWSGFAHGPYGTINGGLPWLFEEVVLTSSTDADTVETAMMDYLGL